MGHSHIVLGFIFDEKKKKNINQINFIANPVWRFPELKIHKTEYSTMKVW